VATCSASALAPPNQIPSYRSRTSGPLLDRIDRHVEAAPISRDDQMGNPRGAQRFACLPSLPLLGSETGPTRLPRAIHRRLDTTGFRDRVLFGARRQASAFAPHSRGSGGRGSLLNSQGRSGIDGRQEDH
jgi:hypothetical protein